MWVRPAKLAKKGEPMNPRELAFRMEALFWPRLDQPPVLPGMNAPWKERASILLELRHLRARCSDSPMHAAVWLAYAPWLGVHKPLRMFVHDTLQRSNSVGHVLIGPPDHPLASGDIYGGPDKKGYLGTILGGANVSDRPTVKKVSAHLGTPCTVRYRAWKRSEVEGTVTLRDLIQAAVDARKGAAP